MSSHLQRVWRGRGASPCHIYLQYITPFTTGFPLAHLKSFPKKITTWWRRWTVGPLWNSFDFTGGPTWVHPMQDSIKRFGGSTAPTAPWPRPEMVEEAPSRSGCGRNEWSSTWYPKEPGFKWIDGNGDFQPYFHGKDFGSSSNWNNHFKVDASGSR